LSSDSYEIEENDWLQLNLIQPLADNFEQKITVINYGSLFIHIIIPGFVNSITVN
jgi:hypothetical protein